MMQCKNSENLWWDAKRFVIVHGCITYGEGENDGHGQENAIRGFDARDE